MPENLFLVRAVNPKLHVAFNSARVRGGTLAVLNKYARNIQADLKRITATWEESPGNPAGQPVFSVDRNYMKGSPSVRVYTNHLVFNYLNSGTNERWMVAGIRPTRSERKNGITTATLRRQYGSGYGKSRPWKINSYRGRGFVRIRGRTAMTRLKIAPRLGIQARHYYAAVREKEEPGFFFEIDRTIIQQLARGYFAR